MRTAVILAAAVLSSCAVITGEGEISEEALNPPTPDYVQPLLGDPSPWVGRSLEELIQERGHPDTVYWAKHTFVSEFDGGVEAMMLVYGTFPCADTFVVDTATKTIIKYYCR